MKYTKDINNKIEDAKNQSLVTDLALEKALLNRCPACRGKLIDKGGGILECIVCKEQTLTDRAKIKKALDEHGPLTARELSKITNIPRSEINAYLDDGMIEIKSPSKTYLRCKICNESLLYGTVCPRCSNNYKEFFEPQNVRVGEVAKTNSIPKEKEPIAGMHYLGRNRNER